ncbi:MAG: 3-dehydroquinate synthase [Waddliaceae bacterium]
MKWNYEIPSPKKEVLLTIERGLLHVEAPNILAALDRPLAVISDEKVAQLHAEPLCRRLRQAGVACELLAFPQGENSKSHETLKKLQEQLLEKGYGRDASIVAIGGGVVTDLAGFLASTYCRGIPVTLIPTSLLGMVDAAIGGKTGINMPKSKNFIGTIYQPEAILIDPEVLETQPENSFRDGLVEMIKHGLIWDVNHFDWIENHIEKLLKKEPDVLEKGIADSCQIKLSIVLQDTLEGGMRRLLNFGHTIGHALESVSQYEMSHGTTVAIGCLVEGFLSDLSKQDLHRIGSLFQRIGIPVDCLRNISIEKVIHATCHDKKAINSVPRFVTLREMGRSHSHDGEYCAFMEKTKITKALEWMIHDLRQLAGT